MTKDTLYIARDAVGLTAIPRLELLRTWLGMTPEMYASRVLSVASAMYVAAVDAHLASPTRTAPTPLLEALGSLQNVGIHAFIDDDPNNLAYVGALVDDRPTLDRTLANLRMVNDQPSCDQFGTVGDALAAAVDLQVIADLSDDGVADKQLRRTLLDHHLVAVENAYGVCRVRDYLGLLTYTSAYLMLLDTLAGVVPVETDLLPIVNEAYAAWSSEPSAAAIVDVVNHRLNQSVRLDDDDVPTGGGDRRGLALTVGSPTIAVYGHGVVGFAGGWSIVDGFSFPDGELPDEPVNGSPEVELPTEAVDWVPPSAETYRADDVLAELFDNGPTELNFGPTDRKVAEVDHAALWTELGVSLDDHHAPTDAELPAVRRAIAKREAWLTPLHGDDPLYSVVCDLMAAVGEPRLTVAFADLALTVLDDHAAGEAKASVERFANTCRAAVDAIGERAPRSLFVHASIVAAVKAILANEVSPTLAQQIAIVYALVVEHHVSGDEDVNDAILREVCDGVRAARAGEPLFPEDDEPDLDVVVEVNQVGEPCGPLLGTRWTRFHRAEAMADPTLAGSTLAGSTLVGRPPVNSASVNVFDRVLAALAVLDEGERRLLLSSAGRQVLTELAAIRGVHERV